MNRLSERTARLEAGGGPLIVDLRDRVLVMENAALASLHANALRLHASGDSKQKSSAAELLPVIQAELARRAALKSPRASSRKPAVRKTKASAKAKVAEPDTDSDDEE